LIIIINYFSTFSNKIQQPKSTLIFASGGQNPFYKKGSGLPKIFHWEGLDTLFVCESPCKSVVKKIDGGFRAIPILALRERNF